MAVRGCYLEKHGHSSRAIAQVLDTVSVYQPILHRDTTKKVTIDHSTKKKKQPSKLKPLAKDSTRSNYFDQRSENNQGIIIGENKGTVLQNPHITIDRSGVSIDSNAIIQNNNVVATAGRTYFNPIDSTLVFWKIRHTGAYNGTKDFQWRGLTMHPRYTLSTGMIQFGSIIQITEDSTVCTYTGILNGIRRK